MRRVYQTRLNGNNGNCFAACIASVLDVDLDGVPDIDPSDANTGWWEQWTSWFARTGVGWLYYKFNENAHSPSMLPGTHVLLGGKSPGAVKRGLDYNHAIVARSELFDDGRQYFRYVHDPTRADGWIHGDPIDMLVLWKLPHWQPWKPCPLTLEGLCLYQDTEIATTLPSPTRATTV